MKKSNHVHGDGEVVIRGKIITARFVGLFNEHGARRITDKIKACVDQFEGQPFAILIDDLKLEGGTPEAYAVLEEYNQWLNSKELIAKAMVLNSSSHKAIINKYSPSRAKQNIEYFTDEESSIAWLKQQIKLSD